MKPMNILKKAWKDSVWSKVIASAITTGLGAALIAGVQHWESLTNLKDPIFRVAHTPVTMPAWLAAVLGVLLVALAVSALRVRRRPNRDDREIQPNAIPVVEATVMTRPGRQRAGRRDIRRW